MFFVFFAGIFPAFSNFLLYNLLLVVYMVLVLLGLLLLVFHVHVLIVFCRNVGKVQIICVNGDSVLLVSLNLGLPNFPEFFGFKLRVDVGDEFIQVNQVTGDVVPLGAFEGGTEGLAFQGMEIYGNLGFAGVNTVVPKGL